MEEEGEEWIWRCYWLIWERLGDNFTAHYQHTGFVYLSITQPLFTVYDPKGTDKSSDSAGQNGAVCFSVTAALTVIQAKPQVYVNVLIVILVLQ